MLKNILYLLLISFHLAPAQDLSDWEIFTYMNDVRDLTYHDDVIWVGTSGGIYNFNPEDNSVKKFSNLDGLASLQITCLATDRHNNLFSGSRDGIIHIKKSGNKIWEPYFELEGIEIVDILAHEDTLWVAANNGVAVYLNTIDNLEFRDFYNNFHISITSANKIAIHNNRIFYATTKGILHASANFQKQNLKIADAWQVINTTNGLPSDIVHDLASIGDNLYIGTELDAAMIDPVLNVTSVPGWGNGTVENIIFNNMQLIFTRKRDYFQKSGDVWEYGKNFDKDISCGSLLNQDKLWLGFIRGGILDIEEDFYVKIDGPASNHVKNVIKDRDGFLWMTAGQSGEGFYQYDFNNWTNYRYGSSWYNKNKTISIYEDNQGKIWIGSWGGGVTIVDHDDFDFYHGWSGAGEITISTVKGETTLQLEGLDGSKTNCLVGADVSGNNTYTVSTSFIQDSENNFWIANYLARNWKYWSAIVNYSASNIPDCSEWAYFGDNLNISTNEREISSFALEWFIDRDRLWVGTFNRGILVHDYNNTITDPTDDRITRYSASTHNLFSNNIQCLATDQDGIIWIGTGSGLNSYQADPSSGYSRFFKHVGDTGPIENNINQIFVDGSNNKWFATDGGLSILMADKSPWDVDAWVHYTTENSGLQHPIVNSVFVDQNSGESYLGTEAGLAVFRGSFSEIRQDMSLVTGGPNPFILDGTTQFTIKNLAVNSQVKIFNISGLLVRKLTSESGSVKGSRAVWDGKDISNNEVPSGIYIYLVYNEEGNTGTGKIAVIRP